MHAHFCALLIVAWVGASSACVFCVLKCLQSQLQGAGGPVQLAAPLPGKHLTADSASMLGLHTSVTDVLVWVCGTGHAIEGLN